MEAKTRAIAEADAHTNNVGLPTYTELLRALRTIVAHAASVQQDPQWAVDVARSAIEALRGVTL